MDNVEVGNVNHLVAFVTRKLVLKRLQHALPGAEEADL